EVPRAQPGRERLAVHARQLALQPHLQILRRYRRPLLCGMEQARRSALAHHVHRTAPMGPRVLINGIWYKTRVGPEGALYFAIRSTNFSRSIGFVRYPTAPSVMPCRRSSTIVAMTVGMSASSGSPRNAARTVQPSISGIITSSVIAIG